MIFDLAIPRNAKVSSIVVNNGWAWPVTQTVDTMAIQRAIPPSMAPDCEGRDRIVWLPTGDHRFSIASAYNEWRRVFPRVDWYNIVWFKAHIPRFSFISWLAIRERLNTGDRLAMFGMVEVAECVFCMGHESHDHLFFNCPFSISVWKGVQRRLNVSWSSSDWKGWICHLHSNLNGNSVSVLARKLAFTATVYHIWIERNMRKFQKIQKQDHELVFKIWSETKGKISSLSNLRRDKDADWLISDWNLPAAVVRSNR